jgi:hypothetical protein
MSISKNNNVCWFFLFCKCLVRLASNSNYAMHPKTTASYIVVSKHNVFLVYPPFNIYSPKTQSIKEKFITTFLYHGPLPFPTRPPFSPLSPQNPLDHARGLCRPQNMSFEDLSLHDHSAICCPWCKSTWSQDKFNIQSTLLHHPGTTSQSMV